jgi:hypothetical protein
MWQYSTETIINSNKGNLTGGVRALVLGADGGAAANNDTDVLLIDGVGSFIKKYVARITKYAYRAAANEVAEITLPAASATTAGVWRLTVALREEGRQSSIMQDAYLHHSKPFHFEVEVESADTANAIAKKFVKAIKKTLAMSDFKFFSAADNSAKLVLTAADCHVRFILDALRIDQIEPATGAPAYAKITGFENFVSVLATDPVIATKGDCGAGTVEHLIKDLRIPTGASINPFAADQGGKPVPGGQYDQYLIEYETPRAHVAHGVMGSVAEKSRTSHVLFLEKTGAAAVAALVEGFIGTDTIDEVSTPVSIPASGIATPKQAPGSVQ